MMKNILLTTLSLLVMQSGVNVAVTCFCNGCGGKGNCTGDQCFVQLVFNTVECKVNSLVYDCQSNDVIPLCTEGDSLHGVQVVRYACCANENYCNLNLSLNSSDINCTTSSVSSYTPTPSIIATDQVEIITIALAVPLALTLCICVVMIGVLSLILHVFVKRFRRRPRPQSPLHPISPTKNNIATQNGHENSLPPYSITTSMEPIHVTVSDDEQMTCTSGSGSGMPFLVKRTIARSITLGEQIGGGRFGQVYLGYYQGEKYAVKKFFSKDEQSWFHESDIYHTFNLRHENILSCFATDMFSDNGVTELWLITQFYPRGSLYDELNRDALNKQKTMNIILSICRGLMYLHMELTGMQGKPAIAHRDIKSKNILVKNDGTCCIADFGLAIVNDVNRPMLNRPEDVTHGTKRYMSPEILSGTINVRSFMSFLRSDMYSFGLVIWEICRRCEKENGEAEEYSAPFQQIAPPDPTFEDMRELIVDKGITLEIPNRWNDNELLEGLSLLIKDCCHRNPAARPTSSYIRKKLVKLADTCQVKLLLD